MVVLSAFALFTAVFFYSNHMLSREIDRFENEQTRQDTYRVLDILQNELDSLVTTSVDYAGWDDTYAYVQKTDQEFINANFTDQTFSNNRLNLVAILDMEGEILYSMSYDLATNTQAPLPEAWKSLWAKDRSLLHHSHEQSKISGYLLVDNRAYMIASLPIITSQFTGPIKGTLIFGREITPDLMARLSKTIHLDVEFRPYDPSFWKKHIDNVYQDAKPIQILKEKDRIRAFTLLRDVYKKPVFSLCFARGRDIQARIMGQFHWYLISLGCAVLVILFLSYLLFDRYVLSRLTRLDRFVRSIQKSGELSSRVSIQGRDELAALAAGINTMLDSLEKDFEARREAETALRKSEEHYRRLVHTATEGFWLFGPEMKTVYISPRMAEILGYTQEEIADRNIAEFIVPEEQEDHRQQVLERTQGKRGLYERHCLRKDGSVVSLLISASPILEVDGRFGGSVALLSDITEHKAAEDAVKASEERYRALFDNAGDGIFLLDNGVIIQSNRKAQEMFGLDSEQLRGKSPWELSIEKQPDDDDSVEKARSYLSLAMSNIPQVFEWVHRRGDGREFFTEISLNRVEIGNQVLVQAFIRDISDRKATEQAIKQSEESYRALFDTSSDAIFLLKDVRCVRFNRRAKELFHAEDEDLLGASPYKFSPNFQPDGQASREKAEQKGLAALEGKPQVYEWVHQRLDGSQFTTEVSLNRVDFNGETLLQVMVHDISERKAAEDALRESREYLRALFDSVNDAILIQDAGTSRIVDANDASCDLFGYPKEELLNLNLGDLSAGTPPYMLADALSWLHKARAGQSQVFEWLSRHKTGRLFWAEVSVRHARIGFHERFLVTVRDFTQRKNAQEALRQSEEHYRSLFLRSMDAVIVHDFEGSFLDANPAALKLLGYSQKEIPNLNLGMILPEDQYDIVLRNFKETIETGFQHGISELRAATRDGTIRFLETNSSLVYKEGKAYAIQLIARDITDRKMQEDALKKSEERLRLVMEATNDGIWDWNLETGKIYYSERFCLMLGYEPDEIENSFEAWLRLIHPEDEGTAESVINIHLKGEIPGFRMEIRMRTKNGNWKWVHNRGKVVTRDIDGRPLRLIGTLVDISERKAAEEAQRRSEQSYRSLFENAPFGIYHATLEGEALNINPTFARMFGWDDPEAFRDYINKHSVADALYAVPSLRNPAMSGLDETWRTFENEYRRKDGSVLIGRQSLHVYEDTEGNRYIEGFAEDITERRRALEALKESERRFRNLLENVHLIAVMLDEEGRIEFCNDFLLKRTGYAAEDVLGRNWFEVFVPEEHRDLLYDKSLGALRNPGEISLHFEHPILTRSGEKRIIVWDNTVLKTPDGRVTGTASLGRDITEQKHLENQLLQAQKMESVGRLAGGIAHDFNNLLTGITGNVSLAIMEVSPPRSTEGVAGRNQQGGGARPGSDPSTLGLFPQADHRTQSARPERTDRQFAQNAAPHDRRGYPSSDSALAALGPSQRRPRTDRANPDESLGQRPRRHAQGRRASDPDRQRDSG